MVYEELDDDTIYPVTAYAVPEPAAVVTTRLFFRSLY